MMRRIFSILCAIIMAATIGITVFADNDVDSIENLIEETEAPTELIEIQETLNSYMSTSDGGIVSFDINAAIAAGENESIISIGRSINQFSNAMQVDPNKATRQARLALPIWGNWCGPGHSGPAAPIDILDAQCKKHDLCYGSRGYFACSCDSALIANIYANYSSMSSSAKIRAAAIVVYFTNVLCNPFA